jgi:hypothetical protein
LIYVILLATTCSHSHNWPAPPDLLHTTPGSIGILPTSPHPSRVPVMDAHDVINEEEYAQKLQQYRSNLFDVRKKKGKRPKRPVYEKVPELYTFTWSMRMSRRPDQHALCTNFRPPAYPPCAKPLAELKKVIIKNPHSRDAPPRIVCGTEFRSFAREKYWRYDDRRGRE